MSYTTQAAVEAKLGRTLTTEEAANLAQMLPAIDAYINNYTNSSFIPYDSEATPEVVYVDIPETRTVYSPQRYIGGRYNEASSKLIIPTMNHISLVEVATGFNGAFTSVSVSDYLLLPRGKNYVYAIARDGEWSETGDTVRITGHLGIGVLPPEIAQIATDMATSGISLRADGVKQEKVDQWWVTYRDNTSTGPIDGIGEGNLATLKTFRRLTLDI